MAAAAVPIGTAPGTAAAAPVTGFQVEHVLLTGDPWPVSYQSYTATTSAPGVARVSLMRSCNALNRPLCLHITRGAQISWLNTSNGRSGTARIPDGSLPGAHQDIRTGPGMVTAYVTSASAPATVIPGFGVFSVG